MVLRIDMLMGNERILEIFFTPQQLVVFTRLSDSVLLVQREYGANTQHLNRIERDESDDECRGDNYTSILNKEILNADGIEQYVTLELLNLIESNMSSREKLCGFSAHPSLGYPKYVPKVRGRNQIHASRYLSKKYRDKIDEWLHLIVIEINENRLYACLSSSTTTKCRAYVIDVLTMAS
ncbi:hypothetical protein DBV15_05378 [Temnothorax longispinosus]|uniref:Uncharacterized protein n=1 Tax=Temnothorax longispinosus TaxID=300112 RepID=A0A4S2JC39_9HYME|nr:hypothetical protein DBV15_05378 [Temnothorax longispinosus]